MGDGCPSSPGAMPPSIVSTPGWLGLPAAWVGRDSRGSWQHLSVCSLGMVLHLPDNTTILRKSKESAKIYRCGGSMQKNAERQGRWGRVAFCKEGSVGYRERENNEKVIGWLGVRKAKGPFCPGKFCIFADRSCSSRMWPSRRSSRSTAFSNSISTFTSSMVVPLTPY